MSKPKSPLRDALPRKPTAATAELVAAIRAEFESYRAAKAPLTARLCGEARWWRSRLEAPEDVPTPPGAWLFNTVAAKHADAMDALQMAGNILPRDMVAAFLHAFERIMAFVIELMRQFKIAPRVRRITGEQRARAHLCLIFHRSVVR